jgi:hypothetical protein
MPSLFTARLFMIRLHLDSIIRFGFVFSACLFATSSFAQMKLPSVDEATEISQRTGRPIFAMAGQKT